jgi:hypothetical protein
MAFTKGITVQSGTEDYYSFDYGNMHVLVLNFMVNYAVGSPQYNFAMTDLSSTNKTWKLVISHAPGYCSGGHGEDAGMKTLATNIFEPKHVDMVLSGHSHFYQHNRVNGIEHMVLGGGGAPLYVPVNASYTLKSVQDYNFGVVDVTSNYFLLKVYNNYNVLLDTVRMIKNTLGISEQSTTARDFSIDEVYPNPSNPEFNVSFDIKTAAAYKLELFDITGRLVEVVKNQKFTPGHYEYSLKTEKFTSGVYFLMLSGAKDFISRKVVVVK